MASVILVAVRPDAFLASCYIAVGSWQFLSCLVHYLSRNHLLRQKSRHFFETILVAAPAAVLVCLVFPSVIYPVSPVLVWVSPLLAAWYCYITYIEMTIWEARAFIKLR